LSSRCLEGERACYFFFPFLETATSTITSTAATAMEIPITNAKVPSKERDIGKNNESRRGPIFKEEN